MVNFTKSGTNKGVWFLTIVFLIIPLTCLFGQVQGPDPKPRPPIKYGSWEKYYGGEDESDCGYSVITIPDGYIIAGYTQHEQSGNEKAVWLIKTDYNGDTLWTKEFKFEQSPYNIGYSVDTTTDGGYIVAGMTCHFYHGHTADRGIYLIKTNSFGDTMWTAKIRSENDLLEGRSVRLCRDGGYIIAGWGEKNYTHCGPPSATIWPLLIKMGDRDTISWWMDYDWDNYRGYSVVQDMADGGYVMTGAKEITPDTAFLIKTYDSMNGAPDWIRKFANACGYCIEQTNDGGYIITGYSTVNDIYKDVWLLKTDSNGNTDWDTTFGINNYSEVGYSVRQDPLDGGYIIAGYIDTDEDGSDVWLIKTDADGNKLWDKTFDGRDGGLNVYDIGYSVDLAHGRGYIIAGSTGEYWDHDVYLIKYSLRPQLEPNTAGIDGGYIHTGILEVFPNPFSSVVYVEVSNKEVKIENIQFYDRSGRLIRDYPVYNNKVNIGNELTTGVYFIKTNGCKPVKAVKLK